MLLTVQHPYGRMHPESGRTLFNPIYGLGLPIHETYNAFRWYGCSTIVASIIQWRRIVRRLSRRRSRFFSARLCSGKTERYPQRAVVLASTPAIQVLSRRAQIGVTDVVGNVLELCPASAAGGERVPMRPQAIREYAAKMARRRRAEADLEGSHGCARDDERVAKWQRQLFGIRFANLRPEERSRLIGYYPAELPETLMIDIIDRDDAENVLAGVKAPHPYVRGQTLTASSLKPRRGFRYRPEYGRFQDIRR